MHLPLSYPYACTISPFLFAITYSIYYYSNAKGKLSAIYWMGVGEHEVYRLMVKVGRRQRKLILGCIRTCQVYMTFMHVLFLCILYISVYMHDNVYMFW